LALVKHGQSFKTMAITINGNGTITGVSVGGLPDGIVDTDMIAANAVTAAKRGAGAVLQVQHVEKTDVYTKPSGTSWVDVPGLSVNITPSSSSNKVLVMYDMGWGNSTGHCSCRLMRDSTAIKIGDQAGSNKSRCTGQMHKGDSTDIYDVEQVSGTILDSPNTTSQVTYKMQVATPYDSSYDLYVNYHYEGADQSWAGRTSSAITLLEVAA